MLASAIETGKPALLKIRKIERQGWKLPSGHTGQGESEGKPSCGRELAKKMPRDWVLQNRDVQGRSALGVCLASSRNPEGAVVDDNDHTITGGHGGPTHLC